MPLQDRWRLSAFVRGRGEWVFTMGEIVVEFARPATIDPTSSESARSDHRSMTDNNVLIRGELSPAFAGTRSLGSVDDREPR